MTDSTGITEISDQESPDKMKEVFIQCLIIRTKRINLRFHLRETDTFKKKSHEILYKTCTPDRCHFKCAGIGLYSKAKKSFAFRYTTEH